MPGYIEHKLEEALQQTQHWLTMAKNRLANNEFIDAMEYSARAGKWANFGYGIFIGVRQYDYEGLVEKQIRKNTQTIQDLEEEAWEIFEAARQEFYVWAEGLKLI